MGASMPASMPASVPAPVPDGAAALASGEAWDAFVERSDPGSYLQLSAWATVKAANGWSSLRLASEPGVVTADPGTVTAEPGDDRPVGAQVLVRRSRPLPWSFAYAPRGPVAGRWSRDTVATFTDLARGRLAAMAGRVSHLRVDPEIERFGPLDPDGALRRAFVAAGWRPAPPIQPGSTRIIDLRADEAALWGDLRKKWRQYVNRARSSGCRVVEAEADRLGEFYAIYRETASRAGFLIRTEQAYRDVWNAFRPAGRARLLFAEDADGVPQATLFLVRCGPRVVEPYGGMTRQGAESRANYLLKWEAIRSSREAGATSYDLWGLASPGIAHFKTGFGGREVTYIGAWDLTLDPLGRAAFEVAQRGRLRVSRWRHGVRGNLQGGGQAQAAGDEGGGE